MKRRRPLVLVAIDHATDVQRTLAAARRLARTRRADLHVLRVVPHGAIRLDDRLGMWRLEYHDGRGESLDARITSALRGGDARGTEVRRIVLRGAPEQVIPGHAHVHRAALLVVERHYGSRLWRSSRVVDELVRQSPIPVLVLPKARTHNGDEPRRILTPVDFSVASGVGLRTAAALAARYDARVSLVHVLQDEPWRMTFSGGEAGQGVRRLSAHVNAVAQRLHRQAAFFGATNAVTRVATGAPHDAILETACEGEVNLIVMGVANRSWLDRLILGSTLRRVLSRAKVPVLVVPVVAGAQAWPDDSVVDTPIRISALNRIAA